MADTNCGWTLRIQIADNQLSGRLTQVYEVGVIDFQISKWYCEDLSSYQTITLLLQSEWLNQLTLALLVTTVYLSHLTNLTPSHCWSSNRLPKCIRNALFIKHATSQNHPQPVRTTHNHQQLPKTTHNKMVWNFYTSGRKIFSSFCLILQLLEKNLRNWLRYF